MSNVVDKQVEAAKAAIAQMTEQMKGYQKTLADAQTTLREKGVIGGGGIKIEVVEARLKLRADAQKVVNQMTTIIDEIKRQIAVKQEFINLENELNRTTEINRALLTLRDDEKTKPEEKVTLNNESRRILAEYERAKADRLDSNNPEQLAKKLVETQAKAATTMRDILDPAGARRRQIEEENAALQKGVNAQIALAMQEQEARLKAQREKDVKAVSDRFGLTELEKRVLDSQAERDARLAEKLEEAKLKDIQEEIDKKSKSIDENKAIKDSLDDFLKDSFGFLIPKESPNQEPGIREIAAALKSQNDVEIDDLVEAYFQQEQAGYEVKALIEARNK